MVDFVIFYEHRARELESVCLIKEELRRRGYKVRVANTYYWRAFSTFHFVKPKIVVVPWLYGNKEVDFFNRFPIPLSKVVNLQCEQIFSKSNRKYGRIYPSDEARKAYHVCWGAKEWETLLNSGIKREKLLLLGSVSMDFNRPMFTPYFKDKHLIAKKYKLDEKKQWILFISSFSYVDLNQKQLEQMDRLTSTASVMANVSKASQQILLQWFEQYVVTHPEKMFIYRPHPSELRNERLKRMENKYENFKVINEGSVRQWIICCDRINNWFSTSLSDAFFLGKSCSILRPIRIPTELDNEELVNEEHITKYEDFEKYNDSLNDNSSSSIAKTIEQYYKYDDIPSYIQLADQLENILHCGCPEDFSLARGNYVPGSVWKQLRVSLFGWLVIYIPIIANIVRRDRRKLYKDFILRECKGITYEFLISSKKIRKIIYSKM